MKNRTKIKSLRLPVLAILTFSSLVMSGCNVGDNSALRVAGGTLDSNGKFPGTVYVEITGKDFENQPTIIRNVGNIVDLGMSNHVALILSVADVFESMNGMAVLPVMKEMDLTIYTKDGVSRFTLPRLSMADSGFFVDETNQPKSYMMAVGIRPQKINQSSSAVDQKVGSLTPQIFNESSLKVGNRDFRDVLSSYVMLLVQKDANDYLKSTQFPKILAAEDRTNQPTKITMVGFGETSTGTAKKNEFALAEQIPGNMKRNYMDVTAFSIQGNRTPLHKLIDNPDVSQVIWEVQGSGLCGSSNGSNYDTGAGIYIDNQLAAIAVRSTSISNQYMGRLDCKGTGLKDMATYVVSPTRSEIDFFKKHVQAITSSGN